MNEQTSKQTESRNRPINTKNKLMVLREGGRVDKMGEGEWLIQATGYGMNNSQRRKASQWYCNSLTGGRWELHLWWAQQNG